MRSYHVPSFLNPLLLSQPFVFFSVIELLSTKQSLWKLVKNYSRVIVHYSYTMVRPSAASDFSEKPFQI